MIGMVGEQPDRIEADPPADPVGGPSALGETKPDSAASAGSGWIAVAGWSGFLAVLIGAFGAHGLPDFLASRHDLPPDLLAKRLDQFDVGVRYHLGHSLALLALALASSGRTERGGRLTGWILGLLLAGIVLFSGSLYVLVLSDTPRWGAVTPLGGVLWLVAWGLIATAYRRRSP